METLVSPGTQIGGYRVESLIGQGGMAQVYKAWHTGLHRHEALKLLPPQMTFDRSFVERFLHEARTAAGLRHPHIATIHTVSQPDEAQPYFTMELVEGGDLADLLRRHGRLPLNEALPILRQIADALDYAHGHGIIHRDVKPANVLLESNGQGGWNVKVVDFGIARAQEAGGARLTKTGMIVGTPEYMSPEQGGSGAPVDQKSDLYSLGVMAYEILCGQPPFSVGQDGTAMTVIMSHIRDVPRDPMAQVSGLPLAVNNAILKALAKHPADRFASCAAFVAALTDSVPVALPTASGPAPALTAPMHSRPPLSRWVPLGLGAAVLVGVVLVAMGWAKGSRPPDGAVPPAVTAPPPAPASRLATPEEANIRVPDLAGLKESQARDFASATSLHLDETTAASSEVPPGHVISQSPASGAKVSPATTVRIQVSTGPEPQRAYRPSPEIVSRPAAPPTATDDAINVASSRRLTEADLVGKSDWDLTVMRNTVYARHGYRFHRADLSSYFGTKPWYSPTVDDQNVIHNLCSPDEKYNVALIAAYQKSHHTF